MTPREAALLNKINALRKELNGLQELIPEEIIELDLQLEKDAIALRKTISQIAQWVLTK